MREDNGPFEDAWMDADDDPVRAHHVWLLALLAGLAWLPLGSYWQSDDFLAVHYASDFTRALADFAGGHYGVETLVVFYRPLITLSFALEHLLGATPPMLSHLSNVIAHVLSAICLMRIAARFVPGPVAFWTALVWALAPSHAGSICWAAGRVDSHTTVWIALAALCVVRAAEGRRYATWLGAVCCALAVGSKELALVIPGIAAVLGYAMAAPGERLPGAARSAWPHALVLIAYFGWRFAIFGSMLSGYEAQVQPIPALVGLGTWTLALANPLTHSGAGVYADLVGPLPAWLPWLGFIPALLGLSAIARNARIAGIACLFLGCAVPMLATWSDTGNLMNLRGFYLPMMPLAALLAAGGWRTALPTLLVFALPFSELRRDFHRSWQRCAALHAGILREGTAPLNFVAGLPRINDRGTSIEMHIGVDRLLRPPFQSGERTVYALRPMSQDPLAHRIPYGGAMALPFGHTLAAAGHAVTPVLRPAGRQDLTLEITGEAHLSIPALDRIVANYQARQNGQPPSGPDPAIAIKGHRAASYRVTVFTAGGYLTTTVADTAPPGPDGRIEFGLILYGKLQAHGETRVGDLLQHGTALDLSARFPVLIEAGDTHANENPVYLDIDRRFAAWWPN